MTSTAVGEPAVEAVPPPRRPPPSGTLLAFVLLICAVLASMTILHPGYADFLAGDRDRAGDLNDCLRGVIRDSGGTGAFLKGEPRGGCDSGDDRTSAGILVSYAILAVATAAYYWFRSGRRARRRGVRPLNAERFPALHAEVDRLVSGVERARGVTVLVDLLDSGVNGVTFGRVGRRHVVLSRGLIRLHEGTEEDRAAFRAVVLHELAHLRNRDVDITMVTLALLRCFTVLVLAPRMLGDLLALVFVADGTRFFAATLLDALVLAGVVLAARSVVLRTREFQADARVVEWLGDPAPLLRAFALAGSGPVAARRRRPWRGRWGRLTRTHPSFAERAACLADRAQLMHQGFGFAFVVGFCLPAAWDPVASATAQIRAGGGIRGWWPTELITLLIALVLFLTVVRAALHRLGEPASAPSRTPFRAGIAVGVVAGYAVAPSTVVDHLMLPGLSVAAQVSGWCAVALLCLLLTVWCQFLADCWARPLDHARRPRARAAALGLVVAVAVAGNASAVFALPWQIAMGRFLDERLAALPEPLHAAVWTQYVVATKLMHPGWLVGAAVVLLGVPLAGILRDRRLARYMVPAVPPVPPPRRSRAAVLGVAALATACFPPLQTWWAHQRQVEFLAHPAVLAPLTLLVAVGTVTGGLARSRRPVWAAGSVLACGLLLAVPLVLFTGEPGLLRLWSVLVGTGVEGALLGTLATALLSRPGRAAAPRPPG
ncbi:M48 family metalloprotease [Streptomyces kanasensis]|uniref:M48 family metalloprotease n=1 Tax=Streptomyces kanasensis TaxID=936756 RepID=UPI003815FC3C